MSFFKGSMPLLPQDITDGFVIGGDPPASRTRRNLASAYKESSSERSKLPPAILTLKIMATNTTQLSAIFCAWSFGDVVAELNPAMVFSNTVNQIPVDFLHKNASSAVARLANWLPGPTLKEVSCDRLIQLGFFNASAELHLVRMGPQWEWRFLIAGLACRPLRIVDTRGAEPRYLEKTLSRFYSGSWKPLTPAIVLLEPLQLNLSCRNHAVQTEG